MPSEIDEPWRVDGLSLFGMFWLLVLPLAKPGLAVTAFYLFIMAWSEVAFASAFLSAGTGRRRWHWACRCSRSRTAPSGDTWRQRRRWWQCLRPRGR
ncbi:ABC transporter permease subunit [Saccharopolyspora spinosa]|uniref:ABC transporter permease subunit n=1 Tax=Saccharopolyspora spinosa TaxID=60894 RepID=UPI001ED91B21|nr:ABC transporter permease subunit [Saccharopolyspora spinosa]